MLFKHKWKILTLSALGFGAAASVYVTRKPYYQSQANLLINYVLQRGGADAHENEMEAGGRSGDQVVYTELEILRSGDLAAEVAQAVGIDRLLPEAGGAASVSEGAAAVVAGLEAKPAFKGSNVVYLTYRNEDPQLTVDVLREVVKHYFSKHLEIHRSVGAFDAVAKEVEEVRGRLRQTETELNKLKSESGIISLADESVSLASQRDRITQDLNTANAEYADHSTVVERLQKRLTDATSDVKVAGAPRGSEAVKNTAGTPAVIAAPKPEEIETYQMLSEKMKFLQEADLKLRATYAAGEIQVVRNQQELEKVTGERQAMLRKTPGLAGQATATPGVAPVNPAAELELATDKLEGLKARIVEYKASLTALSARINRLSEIGPKIAELEGRKEMQDAEYRLLEDRLKKARVDRNLDPTQMPNLKVVQEPSTPEKTFSEVTKKIIFGLAGAGVAVGVGLAFLLELVIDRRIKRPNEIESRLQLPLMLSIPFVRPKNRGALLIANERAGESGEGERSALPAVRGTNGFHAFPPKTDHFIHPYSEAIRDRIVFNFQVNNMTHKPKLMAVTGLSAGAGTSTVAAGLAKAFSEVNGSKVLLVDLNSKYPDDNPMFGNRPLHSLVGALQAARNTRFKEGAQNLYLASAASRTTEPGTAAFGPMHLYELLPHFRASEFDYIIFDMPALAQTSPTLAMAGLMDKVLLIVDGEDTNRETLKWGYSELVKGRADVSCIFNKARSHAPSWVLGEA